MPKIGTFQNDPEDLDSVAFYSYNHSTPYFILFPRFSSIVPDSDFSHKTLVYKIIDTFPLGNKAQIFCLTVPLTSA